MESSKPPVVKTVPMLRDELNVLRVFTKTTVYQDYKAEAKSLRDNAQSNVFGAAPNSIADFVTREQALGEGRIAETFLTWFDDQIDALESIIKEQEAPPLEDNNQPKQTTP